MIFATKSSDYYPIHRKEKVKIKPGKKDLSEKRRPK